MPGNPTNTPGMYSIFSVSDCLAVHRILRGGSAEGGGYILSAVILCGELIFLLEDAPRHSPQGGRSLFCNRLLGLCVCVCFVS